MTFHVLHLFEHGSSLYKKRGRLYCQNQGSRERSLPIENIRAVIIAARGITLSSQLLSALASNNCLVLHCDEKYRPAALSMPLSRVINQRILETQCANRGLFHTLCWKKIVTAKIINHSELLTIVSRAENPLEEMLATGQLDEARAARLYFSRYFKVLGATQQSRAKRGEGWLNALLNYGYSVLLALVHRSIVVHGLIPQLGVCHKPRYGTWPLVYDLMEPFRAVVDAHVWVFCRNEQAPTTGEQTLIERFARFIGHSLRDFRVPHKRYNLKLMDAVDFMARSFATACEQRNPESFWIPTFTGSQYEAICLDER